MEFKKNELINEVLVKNFETFSLTLDTSDYVPEKFLKKTHKYLFKNMKKQFRMVEKEYNKYKKNLKLEEKKKGKKQKRKSLLYRLFCWIKYQKLKHQHLLLCYTTSKEIENKDYVIDRDFTD